MAPVRKQSSLPEGYREDSSKGPMLRFEESLPKLPVPSLQETAKRYLKSVHALLPNDEYAATEKAVQDFIQPGGQGEKLQKRLIARHDEPGQANWLADWWNHAAYLSYRDPVVPYVSYFYSHRDDRKRRDPAKRAAAITSAVLDFKQQVDESTLEPEYMRKLPMAMSSYNWMFNACRVPEESVDKPVKHSYKENEFVVVARKGSFYKVPTHTGGRQLTTKELEQCFRRVYQVAKETDPIGIMTSGNRDDWTEWRKNLLSTSPSNAKSLAALESCSFLICLDDASPVTLEERAHAYWHGNGLNRWFDKPCQFIINDNGTAGFTGEHSMMDGTPTQRLNDYVCALIVHNKLDFDNPSVRSNLPEPERLHFEVNAQVKQDIEAAKKHFKDQINAHELRVQAYQGYGKGLIKRFKCSPDAYIQMIIQLAYHKLYGKNRPTYESAATRRFQLGRTEACRSVSEESVAFCDAMADPSIGPDECREKLLAAINSHVQYISDAIDGRGVDRHLFGLKKLVKEGEEMPAIFTDPAYAYSSTWFISSSQLSSEYFNGYGWSQVIDDGWGIAYMINEYSLQFNIVSKKLGANTMHHYIAEAANDIRDIMLPTIKAPKAKI
ncbi:MAG: Carnitine O-acetyltransferase mitochondrial [Bogoriella megaspora]|nr:MAG: Carnitine O-acetyltransferase mitochondrial [Bogoriella megaspora]